MTEEAGPHQEGEEALPWNTWGGLCRFVIFRIVNALASEKLPFAFIILVVVLVLYHLAYLLVRPVEARVAAESPMMGIAEATSAMLESKIVFWMGWILFALVLVISGSANVVFWQRIQKQGHELKGLRDTHIEGRVSSRDDRSIDSYDARMKKKFGENDDTKNA